VWSYLVIGFWYTDVAKAKAGMKAFIVNRVGDFGFVTGLFFLFWGLGGAWQANDHYTKDVGVGNVVQAAVVEHESEPATHGAEHAKEGKTLTNITVGPSVTFREIHDQLAVTDAQSCVRPLAHRLVAKTVCGNSLVFL